MKMLFVYSGIEAICDSFVALLLVVPFAWTGESARGRLGGLSDISTLLLDSVDERVKNGWDLG